jgi:hypothetical protein
MAPSHHILLSSDHMTAWAPPGHRQPLLVLHGAGITARVKMEESIGHRPCNILSLDFRSRPDFSIPHHHLYISHPVHSTFPSLVSPISEQRNRVNWNGRSSILYVNQLGSLAMLQYPRAGSEASYLVRTAKVAYIPPEPARRPSSTTPSKMINTVTYRKPCIHIHTPPSLLTYYCLGMQRVRDKATDHTRLPHANAKRWAVATEVT